MLEFDSRHFSRGFTEILQFISTVNKLVADDKSTMLSHIFFYPQIRFASNSFKIPDYLIRQSH